MYRPRSLFGIGSRPGLNPQLSLADLPQHSDGGQVVTITLTPYRWSNGDPVTARDAGFWFTLVRANRSEWAADVSGAFPDSVRSVHIDSPSRFSLPLTRASGSSWYTCHELSQLTPIPQAV